VTVATKVEHRQKCEIRNKSKFREFLNERNRGDLTSGGARCTPSKCSWQPANDLDYCSAKDATNEKLILTPCAHYVKHWVV
jgi:hypothetical protein